MNNPQRNLPRVLVAVLITCSFIYTAAIVVAIGMLGPDIAHSQAPLAYAISLHFGEIGKVLVILGMCISILGVAIAVSFSTPYIASSLANEHHLLPEIIGKTTKSGIPVVAILVSGVVAMGLIVSGGYLFLVPLSVFFALIQYVATALSTIKNQRIEKKKLASDPSYQPKGFKLPFGIVIPLCAIAVALYMFANMEHRVLLFGLSFIGAGFLLYLFYNAALKVIANEKKEEEIEESHQAKKPLG